MNLTGLCGPQTMSPRPSDGGGPLCSGQMSRKLQAPQRALSAANGGGVSRGQTGGRSMARTVTLAAGTRTIRWCICHGMMPPPMRPGLAAVCRARQSGNMPRAAGAGMCAFPGVMTNLMIQISCPATSGRAGFRRPTAGLTAMPPRHRQNLSPRTILACTTWSAMSGNGQPRISASVR